MKKWFALFMFALIAVILVACGEDNEKESSTSEGNAAGEVEAATNFPEKAIEIIVPYSAGGNSDTLTRIVSEEASKNLPNGQRYVIVNKEGGGTTIGMLEAAKSKTDGYTLAMAPVSSLYIAPIVSKADYSPDDFDVIASITGTTQVVFVNKDSKFEDVDSWISYAKENRVTVGTAGETHKLIIQTLAKKLGLKLEVIPYTGNSEATVALLSGELDMVIGGLPNILANDEFRALFSVASERSEHAPEIPTLKESGYDFVVDFNNILVAPKGLPDDVKKIISETFTKALESETVQEQLAQMGFDMLQLSEEEVKEMMDEQKEVYGALLENL
jgi:tripartite-type tricarboxylate transporter receptor subunit TctC